jgi:hypothetical protein
VGKLGTPLFQGLTGGDTPVVARPPMAYKDTSVSAGEKHQYSVRSVNAVGLSSPPMIAMSGDSQ